MDITQNKHNTIGKGEKERAVNGGDDKYYTKPYIADYLSSIVLDKYGEDTDYIEPTAGAGAFLNVIKNIVGYDLKPERPNIKQADVFNLSFNKDDVIIGNPPFGFQAGLAVSVFNHIASHNVKAICFVLPKSFRKVSIQNKLHRNYHMVFEQVLVDNAFTVDGDDYNVPCVFQIWEFKKKQRAIQGVSHCQWLEFTDSNEADIAVRRVGGKAGKLLEGLNHTKSTTYFIKTKHATVIKAIQLIDLSVVDNTVGVRSISKAELCFEVDKIMRVLK